MSSNIVTAINTEFKKNEESSSIQETGARILKTEAEAILKLSNELDYHFDEAIELLLETKSRGKVVVTGVGKAGHIGKKIAATLASTGTPSFFVHPNEASHGDMGMVSTNDTVIAISNSGGSKELKDILSYCKRFDIPVIGITKNPTSMVAENSNILLKLPDLKEACPNNLAPTTSTTMILALGDALAITLLEERGFAPSDYKVFHPGGKLGQGLLNVHELMHSGDEIPVVTEETSIEESFKIMSSKNFGTLAVTDANGKLTGILTDGDIRRKLTDIANAKSIKDVMSPNPKTIRENALVGEAMGIMNNVNGKGRNMTCLLVTNEEGDLSGLIHIHDCLKAGF